MKILLKKIVFAAQLALIALFAASAAQAQAGAIDPTFNGGAFALSSGEAYTVARQSDGKILYGGYFAAVNGLPRQSLVRVSGDDGTIDSTFHAAAVTGDIRAIVPLPDGKILIGGSIRVPGVETGVVRLNSDGSLDSTFQLFPFVGGPVFDLAVLSDGKIALAGNFSYTVAGNSRFKIARLNADGSNDATFNPPFNTVNIEDIEVQADGKIIGATALNGSTARTLKRYNTDGSDDTTFNVAYTTNFEGIYNLQAMRIQADGKILIAGGFNAVNNTTRLKIARLNADGTTDSTFDASAANSFLPDIFDIAVDLNGKIIVTGYTPNYPNSKAVVRLESNGALDSSFNFTPVRPVTTANKVLALPDGKILLAAVLPIRINADGTTDTSFSVLLGEFAAVTDIIVQPDGKSLVAGYFSALNATRRLRVGRFNTDGTVDTTFNLNIANEFISGLAVQPDGKILVGGLFIERFMRLNPDGSRDTTFNIPASVINPYDIIVLPNGKILAAGGRIQLLNADGSLDTSFTTVTVGGYIEKIAVQPDGKILVGGNFSALNGTPRVKIARLNQDGSLDATFNPTGAPDQTVFDLLVQADGKVVIGGTFTSLNGSNTSYLARLNSDGTTDTTFNSNLNGAVRAIERQSNGKLVVGGAFTTVDGISRNKLAKLNADGSLDATFQIGTGATISSNNASVYALALQPDAKILVGGYFAYFNGVGKASIVRLLNNSTARTAFDFDGDGKSDLAVFRPSNGAWYVQQSNSGFAAYSFGQSGDQIAPGDFDGDGKTDLAVYRGGTWYIQRSALGFTGITFGAADDLPVPADYDADGKTDVAVFRPSNGTWYLQQSTAGFVGITFGQAGDKPTLGDFDGNGSADIAVFRPSNGVWYRIDAQGQLVSTAFGQTGDLVVPADYDGDGKTDIAVFRAGVWYIQRSALGFTGITFGDGADKPAPADFDGDGKADIAVYRPSTGTWYLLRSTQGFVGAAFGAAEDSPIPNAFIR